eukprot:3065994-Amphidinium_carterae.1
MAPLLGWVAALHGSAGRCTTAALQTVGEGVLDAAGRLFDAARCDSEPHSWSIRRSLTGFRWFLSHYLLGAAIEWKCPPDTANVSQANLKLRLQHRSVDSFFFLTHKGRVSSHRLISHFVAHCNVARLQVRWSHGLEPRLLENNFSSSRTRPCRPVCLAKHQHDRRDSWTTLINASTEDTTEVARANAGLRQGVIRYSHHGDCQRLNLHSDARMSAECTSIKLCNPTQQVTR